ncbi:P-loop containing nucleoside triphosphate hydrolase protein [Rhodofomes roseus]|uniref:P-loop containing nucleoside triphosphate hydrolase protein n=1 Tax=Rhodofomes roseus TaxID=34475 RepID=A0ABQ8KCT0_9APHY|nr:P-loop containing nucleoside triphosphate hydrolase protein [Rhodofomes roseus]KAH9835014.1 P-loop containing nucleoside triphosphate hydrolase protein [Rhodofomes roseus]
MDAQLQGLRNRMKARAVLSNSMQTGSLFVSHTDMGVANYPPIAVPTSQGETVEFDPAAPTPQAVEDPIPDAPTGTVLEIKHLHEVFDQMKHEYIVKPAPAESANESKRDGSKYAAYAFTVIRRFIPTGQLGAKTYNVTTFLEIHSAHLVEIGKEIVGQTQGISWTAKPLRVNPQILLAWLPELKAHLEALTASVQNESEDSPMRLKHAHLVHLIDYLTTTHASKLSSLASLLAHDEITFDMLWALYVPRKTILYTHCPVTDEPRAVRLTHAELCQKMDPQGAVPAAHDPTGLIVGRQDSTQNMQYIWRLVVDYVEADIADASDVHRRDAPPEFGYAGLGVVLDIPTFTGAKKISELPVFPIQYYAGPGGVEGLKARLIDRGKKWAGIAGGVHHLSYQGIASRWHTKSYVKHSVKSRIMIDRKTFADTAPNYPRFPYVTKTLDGKEIDKHARRAGVSADGQTGSEVRELTDDELLLTTPIVYGFSLTDKQWMEFAVEQVTEFQWNDEAFEQLVIPAQHKMVLKTLVDTYNTGATTKFDDFISGKGLGLVINLFGNPGTGKSLTAEAMSEHVRKPLYVVGAADLGTNAESVDTNLTTVFKISAAWGAVVLIDEADVFLEERSLQFLERNAMVAVFLRQLEYFRGILFLTTNRVRVFDEAFQSRIHVSLRYQDLTPSARRQIWVAFMAKINGKLPNGGLSSEELRELAEKKINGRQIKNVVKTAGALAVGRQEKFGYAHLRQVLDLMEQFDTSHAMYQ